jgi:8-oxo-dGTP diphosphatase
MARDIVLAAGGIVVQRGDTPLIAVVCLRKRGDWVLPKGKLDDGETPRDAARREVLEETGHSAAVRDYLGTLAYPLGERTKVVHFWHMEADATPSRKLMKDVTEVAWLPLDAALDRLTRNHEHAFLAQVGPIAVAEATKVRKESKCPPNAPLEAENGLLGRLREWLR